jgi:hypothetical protein
VAVVVFVAAIALLRHNDRGRSGQTAGSTIVPSMKGFYSPFGALAVDQAGRLHIVDQAHDRIDIATPTGSLWRWSTLAGSSGLGATSIAIQGETLWFSASTGIYRTTVTGGPVELIEHVRGVTNIAVLPDGDLYYTTSGVIYLRTPGGEIQRVAGGGDIRPGQERDGQLAVDWNLSLGSIAAVSPSSFYFVNLSDLDHASDGHVQILTPRIRFGNGGALAVAPDEAVYIAGAGSLYRIHDRRYTTVFNPFSHLPHRLSIFAGAVALAISQTDGAFYISFSSGLVPPSAGIVELSSTGRILHLVLTGEIAK